MNITYEAIRGTVILVLLVAGVVWFMWRWLKGAQDPAVLIFRWILTALTLAGLTYEGMQARKAAQRGDGSAAMVVIYALFGGMFLAVIWAPVIVDFVSRRIESLYTGGTAQVEPKPFYSIVLAQRAKGNYQRALTELRRQLEKFPGDYEGMMLLAELQAENLDDMPGAEVTIERLCGQPELPAANVASALNRLADWHLGRHKDREAARADLEKIVERFPETELALRAAQRIGHLADTEHLLAPHDRPTIHLTKGVENLGLLRAREALKAPEEDRTKTAADYVEHLKEHPQDTEAREKLAVIYAQHFHRLDLATDQLEQMIQQPNQPAKLVVHWLNLLADLQVQEGSALEQAQATLQRIIDLYPEAAAAEQTRRRLNSLKLELKRQDQTQTVQMGVYEHNIGLKKAPPWPFKKSP